MSTLKKTTGKTLHMAFIAVIAVIAASQILIALAALCLYLTAFVFWIS